MIGIALISLISTACSTLAKFDPIIVHTGVLGLSEKNNQIVTINATRITKQYFEDIPQTVRLNKAIVEIGNENDIPGYSKIKRGQNILLQGTLVIKQDFHRDKKGDIIMLDYKKPYHKKVYYLNNAKLINQPAISNSKTK